MCVLEHLSSGTDNTPQTIFKSTFNDATQTENLYYIYISIVVRQYVINMNTPYILHGRGHEYA